MKTFITGLLVTAFALAVVMFVPKQEQQNSTTIIPTITVVEQFVPNKSKATLSKALTKSVKNYTSLNTNNTIFILDEISQGAVNTAQEILTKSQKEKEVYVLINSPGGSVLDGALVVSAIQASRVPVHTVCMQLCASMAAIIHAYGTERDMVDRSVLMYHQAAGGVQGYVPQMLTRLNFIDRYTKKFDTYIANRAGTDPAAFASSLSDELWYDAEDATAKHFNDAIISLDLGRFPSNKTSELEQSLTRTARNLMRFGAY